MKMLGRLAAILAILASAGSLYFISQLDTMKKQHIAKIAELDSGWTKTKGILKTTETKLDDAHKTLKDTQTKLDESTQALESSKVELATKTKEAEDAKTELADMKPKFEKATTELASANDELKKVSDALASLGGVAKVEELKTKVQNLVDESKVLNEQLGKMRTENKALATRVEELSTTPMGLRGKVLVSQDNWNFVVLDIGRDQRVQPKTQFLVYRDTKMIAKVEVINVVGPTTSVAEILPEYRRSSPREGDLVVH